jgi:hypothetical protein
MEKLTLFAVAMLGACTTYDDIDNTPLSEFGYGELNWLQGEKGVCVGVFNDKDGFERIYLGEKTKKRCDQIAGINFFPIESIKDKEMHVRFINAFGNWLKQQRAGKQKSQNELADCIIKDRSTFVYRSDFGINEELSLTGATLDLKGRGCPKATAEVTLWPDGRVSVNIFPTYVPSDPLE